MNRRQPGVGILFLLTLCAVLAGGAVCARAAVTWRTEGGEDLGLDSYTDLRGEVLVSLIDAARAASMTWSWDPHGARLTVVTSRDSAVFSTDMAAVRIRDSVHFLEHPAVRRGGHLYCSVRDLVASFSRLGLTPVLWNATEGRLEWGVASRGDEVKIIPDSLLFRTANPGTFRTVVLDPGHGGKDPGCVGPGGTYEKDITLAIALKVRDLLREHTSFDVRLTREKDEYVRLRDRTRMANDWKADLFVSIHADAISGSAARRAQVSGHKVYFLSQARNEAEKLVAMRENAVIEFEDTPEEYDLLKGLISDLMGNEYLNESQDFSILLSQTFERTLARIPKLHLGVGQAPFWVLTGAFMPAVLVEVGFLSNPAEEKLLNQPRVQTDIARALKGAIVEFGGRYEVAHE